MSMNYQTEMVKLMQRSVDSAERTASAMERAAHALEVIAAAKQEDQRRVMEARPSLTGINPRRVIGKKNEQ
jgi:hypothetical protein